MKINEVFGGKTNDEDSFVNRFKKRAGLNGIIAGGIKNWNKLAQVNNLNTATKDPVELEKIKKYLQAYTAQYMTGNIPDPIKTNIIRTISETPLPNTLSVGEVSRYFTNIANARENIIHQAKYKLPDTSAPEPEKTEPEQTPAGASAFDQMAKGLTSTPAKPAQPAAPAAAPTQAPQPAAKGPLEGTGVTVIQSFPLVLRYKKHDFQLTDENQWVDVFRGTPVNPTLASFLQAQANKL